MRSGTQTLEEVRVERADLEFRFTNSPLSVGDAHMVELEEARTSGKRKWAERKARGAVERKGRGKREKGLRENDSWP